MSVELAHAIPGRLRLRVASLKDDPSAAASWLEQLAAIRGVETVDVRRQTSSVVVNYDPSHEAEVLLAIQRMTPRLAGLGPVASGAPSGNGSHKSQVYANDITSVLAVLNRRVAEATGGIDLKLLVPVLLFTFAILAIGITLLRRNKLPTPSWYDLLWFAFNTFVILDVTKWATGKLKQDAAEECDSRSGGTESGFHVR